MIVGKAISCSKCGGNMKYYDSVYRIVRTKGREAKWVKIKRLRCMKCGYLCRELPDYIFPYKQYEAEIVKGVIDGLITSETLGYEDYPCEATMIRWKMQGNRAKNTFPIVEGGEDYGNISG